jgi:hypothetical protein
VKRSSRACGFDFPKELELLFFVGEGGAGRRRDGIFDVHGAPAPPAAPLVLEPELASVNRMRPPPCPIAGGGLWLELRAVLAGDGEVAKRRRSSAESRSRCAAESTGDAGAVSMPLPFASFPFFRSPNPTVLPLLLAASSVSPPRLIASAASAMEASMDDIEDL